MASREDREDPGYGDGKMTSSTEEGAYLLLHLKHTILNPKTARNLEHMKSKILSGIKLKSPSGSKRKALRIQEPEAPQAREATNGAARGRSLPRELQFQQQERGDKEMTDSIKGALDLLYLKHTILDYKTARKLEHMKSKILSGIELNSPSGSKQKALQIQESEATNGAAQGRRELQFQQEEGGGEWRPLLRNPFTKVACVRNHQEKKTKKAELRLWTAINVSGGLL
ncbi:hypothetical protein GBA52_022679 [Prunus armeniaca]|nr:hypothetical protein GBA52_022679 [Prunus armeniaca]